MRGAIHQAILPLPLRKDAFSLDESGRILPFLISVICLIPAFPFNSKESEILPNNGSAMGTRDELLMRVEVWGNTGFLPGKYRILSIYI